MNTITFELSTPIKYASGAGGEVECSHIELRAPTGRVGHIAGAIEGLIQSNLMKLAGQMGLDSEDLAAAAKDTPAPVADGAKDGDAMMSTIAASGAEVDKVILQARELFKVCAYMGGEKPITSARLDDMSYKDLRRMTGVYIANFVMG